MINNKWDLLRYGLASKFQDLEDEIKYFLEVNQTISQELRDRLEKLHGGTHRLRLSLLGEKESKFKRRIPYYESLYKDFKDAFLDK